MNAHTIWIRELSVSEAELYYYYTITIITMLCGKQDMDNA